MADKTAKVTKNAKTPTPAAVAAAPAKAVAGKSPADRKAEKEARERVAQGDKFIYVGAIQEGAKRLAPQAQGIVNLVQAAGKSGLTRAALVKGMDGVVPSRQPLGRILSYYQKSLIESGYLKLEKAAGAEAEETADEAGE